MNNEEAIIWLTNLTSDIGKLEHRSLWHYEQALSEIKILLGNYGEDGWIPCKKKQPEDFEWVYAQTIYGEHIVTKYVPPKIKPESHPHGYWGDTDYFEYDYFDVVAWRHLPEPYLGDKDDFNNKRFDS